MAYRRKGRHPVLDPAMVGYKPPRSAKASADLPMQSAYAEGEFAPPGYQSVVGRPVPVFDTLPANGKKFAVSAEALLPVDWEPADGERLLAEFRPPVGWVMVITGWQVVYVPGNTNDNAPLINARILSTNLVASVKKNEMVDEGAREVVFRPFDRRKECHIVAYGDDRIGVFAFVDTDPTWQAGQVVSIRLTGVYLQPNNMAPEYTELALGEVKVVKQNG